MFAPITIERDWRTKPFECTVVAIHAQIGARFLFFDRMIAAVGHCPCDALDLGGREIGAAR
jgi:hypothetical protein